MMKNNINQPWIFLLMLCLCSSTHPGSSSTTNQPVDIEITASSEKSNEKLSTKDILESTLTASLSQEKVEISNLSVNDEITNSKPKLTSPTNQESSEVPGILVPPPVTPTLPEPPPKIKDEPEGKAEEQPSEAMPSFNDWKKMMLAEQKEGRKDSAEEALEKAQSRRRNYASYECGAKVVAKNTEAENPNHMLNEQLDEYMLSLCKVKIWFVLELCESVQTSQIELANFELFSSTPKEFTVSWSDRYPPREWTPLGTFVAPDLRSVHTFQINQQGFGKFIKVELLSHHGSEHYCPISLVRVFGTSMVDEYEEMEKADQQAIRDTLEDERLDMEESNSPDLFGSAKDAMINLVKNILPLEVAEQEVANESLTTLAPTASLSLQPILEDDSKNATKNSGRLLCSDVCPLVEDTMRTRIPMDHQLCRFLDAVGGKDVKHSLSANEMPDSTSLDSTITSKTQDSKQIINPSPTLITDKELGQSSKKSSEDSSLDKVLETASPVGPPAIAPSVISEPSSRITKTETIQTPTEHTFSNSVVPIVINSTPTLDIDNLTNLSLEEEAALIGEVISEPPATQDSKIGHKEPPLSSTSKLDPAFAAMNQKESVFVRMGNRIKALELNMSLSGLYLHELSQRYRKQMEDMQRSFNQTIAILNNTAKKAFENDQSQVDAIIKLQMREANLTELVSLLMVEREDFKIKLVILHFVLVILEVGFLWLIHWACNRRSKPYSTIAMSGNSLDKHHLLYDANATPLITGVKRSASEPIPPVNQVERPPEQPTGVEPPRKVRKRNRRHKKNTALKRSHSNPHLASSPGGENDSTSQHNSTSAGVLFSSHLPPQTNLPLKNLTNTLVQPTVNKSPDQNQKSSPPPNKKVKPKRNPSV